MSALQQFKNEAGLSFRQLANLCGGPAAGANQTVLRKLCTGAADPKTVNRLRPLLLKGVEECAFISRQRRDELLKSLAAELSAAPTEEEEDIMNGRTILQLPAIQHFDLRRDPFGPVRSAEDVFLTPALRTILTHVNDAIEYREFRAVIGPVGAGKTVLRQLLQDMVVNQTNGSTVLVWPTTTDMRHLSVKSIETAIYDEFGEDIPSNSTRRHKRLVQILDRERHNKVRVTLCFDEAHDLTDRTLLKLKDFYEMGYGFNRYLGVLMFGQPPLLTRLKSDLRFREIFERMDISQVEGFSAENAWQFVAHRISRAGGNVDGLIDREVVVRLALSNPTPLSLGNACNAAMMKAWQLGEPRVTMAMMDFGDHGEPRRSVRKTA